MAVRGEVDQIPLSHIIQGLLLNGQEGVLRLEGAGLKRRIRIVGKGLRPLNYSRETPDLLREALLKQKITTESQLHNVLSTWLPGSMPPGDFLLRRGIFSPEFVQTKISRHLANVLLEVLCAPGLKYEFSPEEDPVAYEMFAPEGLGQRLVFDFNSVVLEAMRRADEWTRFRAEIPSANEVFALVNRAVDSSRVQLAPEVWRELRPLLNGEHSVSQIIDRTSLSDFEVYSALFLLKGANLIRPIPLGAKKALAEKLRRSLRPGDAAAILRSVLDDDPEDDESRIKLIALLEKEKGNAEELISHYLQLANHKWNKNDPEQCEHFAKRALELDKTNVTALGLLFEISERKKDDKSALAVARAVVAAAREGRDRDAAIGLLYRIINFYPDETFLYHELAAIHETRGEPEAAVDCLRSVAQVHASRGDKARVRKTEERIARLDPTGASSSSPSRRSQRTKRARNRNPLLVACLAAALGATVLIPFLFGTREILARQVYAEVKAEVEIHKRYSRLDRARDSLRSFLARYGESSLSPAAKSELKEIEASIFEAEERAHIAKEQRTSKAESDYVRARIAHRANDYQKAAELLASLDYDALDPRLAHEAQALQRAVEEYLRESESLARRSAGAEDRGDIAEAHRLRREILAKYQYSRAAQNLRLPVEIRSVPPGATVLVDGVAVGKTPVVLRLGLARLPSIRLELESFEPVDLSPRQGDGPGLNPLESHCVETVLAKVAVWKTATRASIEAVPAVVGDGICLATRGGEVILLSQEKGTAVWNFRIPSGMDIAGSVGVWGDYVYFGSFDGHFYLLNAKNGQPAAKPIRATEELLPIKCPLSEPTPDGWVVANADFRVLVGLSLASREVAWSFSSGTANEFVGRPAVFGDSAFVSTSSGQIVELDVRSGSERRRMKVAAHLSFSGTLFAGKYYLGTPEGTALAIDLAAGKVQWSVDVGDSITAPPGGMDRSIAYPLSSGAILALTPDGRIRWRTVIGDTVAGTFEPAVVGDRLYFGTRRGLLVSIDANTGSVLWKFRTEGSRSKEPRGILAGCRRHAGRIYFGSEDHFFYCLSEFP